MADRLRKAREERRWTQADLATASGGELKVRTIANYESDTYAGERKRSTIRSWAFTCGVPFDWLMTGEEPIDYDDPGTLGERDSRCTALSLVRGYKSLDAA